MLATEQLRQALSVSIDRRKMFCDFFGSDPENYLHALGSRHASYGIKSPDQSRQHDQVATQQKQ
jgi:hypothetical protein